MEFGLMAAIDFAKRAHDGQLRRYTNEPYVSHPIAVAGLVASVSTDDDMMIAAVLHDTVEDTHVELATIEGVFGAKVAAMVDDLTDVSRAGDGNRRVRKEIALRHTANASKEAKTIKLADLIDNIKTIIAFDPNFAKVYMAEKRKLLVVLKDGDEVLFKIANDLVENFFL